MGKVGRGAIYCPDEVETLVFDWGRINLLSEPKLTGAGRMTCGLVQLQPGQGHDRHNHPGTEEIIFVVSGEGEQVVDDQPPVRVGPGACIFVPDGIHHSTHNTGTETMRLLVVYAPTGPEETLRSLPGVRIEPPEGR